MREPKPLALLPSRQEKVSCHFQNVRLRLKTGIRRIAAKTLETQRRHPESILATAGKGIPNETPIAVQDREVKPTSQISDLIILQESLQSRMLSKVGVVKTLFFGKRRKSTSLRHPTSLWCSCKSTNIAGVRYRKLLQHKNCSFLGVDEETL